MHLSTQPYKGARDFYPEDKRFQDYMFNIMRQVAASYGYEEYDSPILEPIELYKAKTGDEIVNEQTYSFVDRGGREVVIRPEMTPTVSRMVAARRQELPYPLRWFSIPNLWRYERPQRGRLREHWQLNVDIFGDDGLSAEHEIISVADSVLKAFGAQSDMYQIKLNSRVLIEELFNEYLNLTEQQAHALTKLIDKMAKLEESKFNAAVNEICPDKAAQVIKLLSTKSLDKLPAEISEHQAVTNLSNLIELLNNSGISNVVFDITLMRGFDYYTDIVFEVFDTDPENNRSMFGGGRYDGLVGLFGVAPVPTVGFGMGDVTLANFLESHKLTPQLETSTDLAILVVGDVYSGAAQLASRFRHQSINTCIDATDRKLDRKIKAADKLGIRHIIFIGESELGHEQYSYKNLQTGDEEKLSFNELVRLIKA